MHVAAFSDEPVCTTGSDVLGRPPRTRRFDRRSRLDAAAYGCPTAGSARGQPNWPEQFLPAAVLTVTCFPESGSDLKYNSERLASRLCETRFQDTLVEPDESRHSCARDGSANLNRQSVGVGAAQACILRHYIDLGANEAT